MSGRVAGPGRGAPTASRSPAARWVLGVAGAGLMASAFLPWLTLFAGLRGYAGLTGPTGIVVLVAGAWMIVAALQAGRAVRAAWVVALLAVAWSVTGILELRHLPTHRMLVPGIGTGVWVALACLALSAVVVWRTSTGEAPRNAATGNLPA